MYKGKKMEKIYLTWDGPYFLKDLKEDETLNDERHSYGIYQIYGAHPVYGSNVLLYIGKADRQTFSKRILQEYWTFNSDSKNIEIYIGKLFAKNQPSNDEWGNLISHAEKLLIYTHSPAQNSANINTLSKDHQILSEIRNVRVINYDNYRDLMPEVSGDIYIDSLDWYDNSKIFTM
ncbi:MAG: hypothetical protein J7M14_06615 [Planctomycetes bacterium]|nr:hypothetical protein [Planctomycetota bacterium]